MGDLNEEEMDKLIEEEVTKDIDQADSIDEELVESSLQEMGFLWETLNKKLHEDATCFDCKQTVDFAGTKMHVLNVSTTDKGTVAFVSICEACYKKLEAVHLEGEKSGEE